MRDDHNKKRKFRLFDTQREGKGIKKEDVVKRKPNFRGFFSYLRRDFSRLFSINLFLIIGNFPLLFAILAFSGVGDHAYIAPESSLLTTLQGVAANEGLNAATSSLMNISGLHLSVYSSTIVTYILYGLSLLVVFTFGFVSVGTTYQIRNMLMGEPVFLFSDFRYAIKRNWKQGLIAGILDVLAILILSADLLILFTNSSDTFSGIFLGVIFIFFILYLFMRPYIYLQLITFDLKLFKILKNSLILAILGLKRNILALITTIFLFVLFFFMLFGLYGILIPIGLALGVAILPALISYISLYAAYFKMKEIMIDPYYQENQIESNDEPPIAIDRG